MRLWKIYIAIGAVFLVMTGATQDVHFSQFDLAPFTANPALSGAIRTDQRFIINYKDQWAKLAKFRTMAASYDLAILKRRSGRYLGVGISAYSDKAGKSEFGNTQVDLNVAYNLPVNKKNSLSMGLKVGWGQRSAKLMELRWDNQWTGFSYDPSLPTGESAFVEQSSFVDLGAGILWRKRKSDMFSWSLGAAGFHLNSPNISLIGSGEGQYLRKYVLHGGMEFRREKYDVLPKFFIAKQGGAYEVNIGSMIARRLGGDSRYTKESTSSSVQLGLFYRVGDALIPRLLYEYKRLISIGVSYDVNLSRLREQSRYQGGIEIAIVYHGSFTDKRRKLKNHEGR